MKQREPQQVVPLGQSGLRFDPGLLPGLSACVLFGVFISHGNQLTNVMFPSYKKNRIKAFVRKYLMDSQNRSAEKADLIKEKNP